MIKSSRPLCAVPAALLVALVWIFTAGMMMAQQTRPGIRNPPALPSRSHSSRPVPPGKRTFAPQGSAVPSTSLNPSTWTPIGPASLTSGGGLVSGRVTGIAVDPTDANTIYVATAGGGVWKTTTGGTSWVALTDNQETLAMGSIAVAPSNHLKIYAGTGEANNSGDSNRGEGILVSDDGGTTWKLEDAGGAFSGVVIGQIAVDPTNADVAYAAVGGYGEDGKWFAETGIWKTTDGGTTWTNTTAANSLDSMVAWTAVVIDPNTPTILYAALGDIGNTNSDNGVFRSTDGGVTWSQLANVPTSSDTGRIALAVSPVANQTSKHVLYVAIESINTAGLGYFGRSDNADAATPTFTDLTPVTPDFLGGENGGGQGWYDIAVNVDATGVVYCAGVEDYSNNGADMVILSKDLGAHWTDISTVGSIEPHTDSHAIAFDPSNRMLLGSDGGVFRYDPTSSGSWTILNSNLNTILFTGIGLHPTSPGTVFGGSQDNGTEVYNNNLIWTETDGGDGGFGQISPTTPTRCYADHPIASFGPGDFFRRSDDGCSTWTSKTSGLVFSNANFYPPFVVDPTNGNHLLLGMDYVNESTDGADSWTPIGTPGTNNFNPNYSTVDSVALAPTNGTNPQVIYAAAGGDFASTSQIFVTEDDGATWMEHDLPSCTTDQNNGIGCRVKQIVTDPSDPTGHTAFAVTSNLTMGGQHVYWTATAGATWTDISGNLPNLPVWSVQVDTDSNHTLYISTDAGVYSSPSPYGTWAQYGTSLPNAQGLDLELNRSLHVLAVATHGRGAWEILTPQTPQTISFTQPTTPVTYAPGLTITLSATGSGSGNPVVFSIDSSSTGSGTISGNTLTVTDAGTLVIDANQAGNTVYAAAAQVQQTVVVNQASQVVTFTQPTTPVTYSVGLAIPLDATGGASGNSVVFTLDPSSTGTGTISGSVLTVTGAGTLVIDANQASDTNYAVATQVQKTVVVNKAAQTISVTTAAPASAIYNTHFTVAATATSGLAISYSSSGGCSNTGAVFTLTSGTTPCTVTYSQPGSVNFTAAANVTNTTTTALATQAALTVTGVPTAAQAYNTHFTVGSQGGSGTGTVTFSASGSCSIAGTTVTVTSGSGTCSVTAAKAADTDYSSATSQASAVAAALATQAALTVTGVPTAAQAYNTHFTVGSQGGSGTGAVTFSASGSCSIAGTTVTMTSGSGTCSVTAAKAADTDYSSATSQASPVAAALAAQATLSVTGVPSAGQIVNTHFTVGSQGGSGTGAVTFSASGACSASGTTITITGASGTCSVTATKAADSNYASATSAPSIVAAVPAVPVLMGVSPAVASGGSAAFTLTVTGSAFVSNSTVYWGSTAIPTTYVNEGQLIAQVPATDIATGGIYSITVQTPSPGGGTSNSLQFEVDTPGSGTTPPSFATVTATVTPGSTATYPVTLPSSATNITANCLNLPSGAACSYSATTKTLTITTSATTPAGTYQITVVFTETLPGAALAFLPLPILLLPLLLLWKKRAARGGWFTVALMLVLVTASAVTMGCGGSSGTHVVTSSSVVSLTVH